MEVFLFCCIVLVLYNPKQVLRHYNNNVYIDAKAAPLSINVNTILLI